MDAAKDQSKRSRDHDESSIQEQPELSDSSRILHHDQNEKDIAEDNPNPSDEVDPVSSIPSARSAENNPPSEDREDDESPEMDNEAGQEETDHQEESIQEHGGNEGNNNKDLLNDDENKSDDDDENLHSVNNTDDLDDEGDRNENPDDDEAAHEIDNQELIHQEPADRNEGDDHQEPAGGNEGDDHKEPADGNEGDDHQAPIHHQEPAGGNEGDDHQEPAGGNEEDDHQVPLHEETAGENEEDGHQVPVHEEPAGGNEDDDHQVPIHDEPAGGNEGDHQVPIHEELAGGNEGDHHQVPIHEEPAGGNEGEIAPRLEYAVNDSISWQNFLDGDEALHVEGQSLYINYKRNCNNNNNQDQMKIFVEIDQVIELLLGAYERCFEVHDAIIEGRIILQEGPLFQIERHFFDIYLCCIKLSFEDGFEILEALRRDPTRALPVIMQRLKRMYEQCCESRSLAYSRYNNLRRIYFFLDSS